MPGAEMNPKSTAHMEASSNGAVLSFSIPPAAQPNKVISPQVSTILMKADEIKNSMLAQSEKVKA